MTIKFHRGGAGFILSKKSLLLLSPLLANMVDDWIKFCKVSSKDTQLIYGCDVCISYYCSILNIQMLTFNDRFYDCNYRGNIQWKDIITCHNMSLRYFDEFTDILNQEKWYINYIGHS